MTVEELLVDLARRGIQVWTEGDNLNVRVPKGTLSLALRTALTECKPEIMWHLSHGHANGTGVREYPLSYGQRTFWFYYQIAPEPCSLQCHARRVDPLGPRHSQVAACMPGAGRSPCPAQDHLCHSRRRACPAGPRPSGHLVEVTDAARWDWDTLDARLQEIADCPFDLEQGPVLRVHIFTRSPHEHLLLLTVHHIAVDFWSLGMINDELAVLYENERSPVRGSAPLPPPALEYKTSSCGRPSV